MPLMSQATAPYVALLGKGRRFDRLAGAVGYPG